MEANDSAPALMSLPEVARYLNMKERTIYDWAQTGRLPAFKLGATWRFRRSEIDAWLETQRSGPDVRPVREPLVPPVEQPPTERQVRQTRIASCREEIESALSDPSRQVLPVQGLEDEFGHDVVDEVLKSLIEEKQIRRVRVSGRDGKNVRAIERRT